MFKWAFQNLSKVSSVEFPTIIKNELKRKYENLKNQKKRVGFGPEDLGFNTIKIFNYRRFFHYIFSDFSDFL